MISYLKGKVLFVKDGSVAILANNIGWDVRVFDTARLVNEEIELYIYTHVRESEISLWGFDSANELKLFELLLSVSGVGPKTAQNILGNKGINEVVFSIINGDAKALKVSGVGEKTAQKIIIELKGKVSQLYEKDMQIVNLDNKSNLNQKIYFDSMEALLSLGYSRADIEKFLMSKLTTSEVEYQVQDLVKEFLKSI